MIILPPFHLLNPQLTREMYGEQHKKPYQGCELMQRVEAEKRVKAKLARKKDRIDRFLRFICLK